MFLIATDNSCYEKHSKNSSSTSTSINTKYIIHKSYAVLILLNNYLQNLNCLLREF